MELLENKWQDLKNWYISLAELLAEGLKLLILSLPTAILGILGLLVFILVAIKIGWWVLPVYIILMFFGVWVYYRFSGKKEE